MSLQKPKLRAVEAIPLEYEGRPALCLRDPAGLASNLALVFQPLASALAYLDGQHSLEEVYAKLHSQAGLPVRLEELRQLTEQMDHQFFLQGPRITARRTSLLKEYRQAPARPASLAGISYPADGPQLRQLLDGFYLAPGGPGKMPGPFGESPPLAGALVPHVDLPRGGHCFAHTYRQLAEESSQARRFVVFGTGHALGALAAATVKDFQTPLGPVRCDRPFLERLQEHVDLDLYAEELTHRSEHSIEFQALYLAHLFGGRRDISLVPILCGSFYGFVEEQRSPSTSARVEDFVQGMRATLAEFSDTPTLLLGAIDLSHVGPSYGDEQPVDAHQRQAIREADLEMLTPALRGDAEGFFQAVAADGDQRRICGLSPLYLMLRCLKSRRGQLLAYDQANDTAGTAIVSFASAIFPAL